MRPSLVLLLSAALLVTQCTALERAIKPRHRKINVKAPIVAPPNPEMHALLASLMDNPEYSTSGVGASCGDSSGASGSCVDTYASNSCEYGILTPGLCPGPDNVECCLLKWGTCGNGGSCVLTQTCALFHGVSTPGECPGPAEVQCCTPSGPAPPPPSGGNIGALVAWANDNCAASQGWECAEFAARSIAAGGFIPGLDPEASTDVYANWNGYNLRMVGDLHNYLVTIGWTEQSTDPNALQAGWPIFGCAGYCPSGGWEHACIGVSGGTVDCHNSEHCQVSAAGEFAYYGCTACVVNSILAPP